MKKAAILLLVIILTVSCEKESDPQLLSDFITQNEWVTTLTDNEPVVDLTYIGTFYTDGTYSVAITDGTITLSATGEYSVNNQTDVLTLDVPDIGQDDYELSQILFDVEWTEGVKQMFWKEVDNPENTLTWLEYTE